jgi:extracellular elastinolytic metalloproteinase
MKIMKKFTLLFIVLASITGFSQNAKQKIQSYLNANYQKLGLTNQDINDWYIQSEGDSDVTKINNYYVMQRHNGIDIFRANTNFSIKNGEIINVGNRFLSNVSLKSNATSPTISVTDALSKAYISLNIVASELFSVLENPSNNKYVVSNGLSFEHPVTAELVYQQTKEKTLRLAWSFDIETPDHAHLWSIRIDAVDGKMLEKNDMVISCNFDSKKDNSKKNIENKFTSNFYKENQNLVLAQVLGGSYRVIPFNYSSPDHSPFQLITNPENALASPNGWHNASATIGGNTASLKYTITRGNNVWAKDDFTATNSLTGSSPNGGTSLNFDFPYGGISAVPNTYINAANTNLFYMNNICHDIWYQYGFNELNGNFQASNLGRGPSGASSGANDFVFGDAQDGGNNPKNTDPAQPANRNNANFSTPIDSGTTTSNPRMQMFIWDTDNQVPKPLFVISPASIAGNYKSVQNSFTAGHVDLPVAPGFLQSNLVLYDDGTADIGQTDNADACGPAVNAAALSGKIALIRRSRATTAVPPPATAPCPFSDKVKNAQDAGAIAVIIMNNVYPTATDGSIPNDPTTGQPFDIPIGMIGANAAITIPAIGISKIKGDVLVNQMATSPVNAKLQLPLGWVPFVASDGDFDNTIIAHEYGHGISSRLQSGRLNNSCLSNYEQMGEGWSDFFGLMLQLKPSDTGVMPKTVATFAEHDLVTGPGIRRYPYSTDMSINPKTFANSNIAIPADPADTGYRYTIGEFWATVLWDLNWAYIAKYGYNDDKYTGTGGNNKLMRLVLDGIKLQACGPSIVAGRDALIAADQATTGGLDKCLITEVFRRRGVGLNASSGSSDDCGDQVEDFTPFVGCESLGTNGFGLNNSDIRVYPNPTSGQFNVKINQFVGKINIQVIDINGRLVLEVKEDNFNNEKTIDLSGFQSGVYLLRVNSEEANFTQKIIKK